MKVTNINNVDDLLIVPEAQKSLKKLLRAFNKLDKLNNGKKYSGSELSIILNPVSIYAGLIIWLFFEFLIDVDITKFTLEEVELKLRKKFCKKENI